MAFSAEKWYNHLKPLRIQVFTMATNHNRTLYKDYEAALLGKQKAEEQVERLNQQCQKLEVYSAGLERESNRKDEVIEKLDKENAELRKRIARLEALLGTDSTNSSLPTSKTPISKKKVIPNSREKSGRTTGGQPGHPKSKLNRHEDYEITEHIVHKEEVCPDCGGEMEETGADITKDVTDFHIVIDNIRHHFPECRCGKCGKISRVRIPNNLKEENQYGPHIQTLVLGLTNVACVPVNKVQKMVEGLTNGHIVPSEGYILKLQKQAAKGLKGFHEDVKKHILAMPLLYWDDTVISVDTKRACFRFYGDEKTAYYTAHEHKDKASLTEDAILPLLPQETVVMHDHNIVNYNSEYSFTNIECNAHLLRDLQKVSDHTQHAWASEAKKLISEQIRKRNELAAKGIAGFTEEETKEFFTSLYAIIYAATEEAKNTKPQYGGDEERALLLRLAAYRDAYFAWVVNFNLPVTNNTSERALRGCKTKMKVSGQFQVTESARNYAVIKTYLETCVRNGLNEMDAIMHLCMGQCYTADEVLHRGCE